MATAEPYRPVSASDDDGDDADAPRASPSSSPAGFSDDGFETATQSPDLESAQDRSELEARTRSIRSKILVASCLLAAAAFGGREYYARNPGEGGGLIAAKSKLFSGGKKNGSGVRGKTTPADDAEDATVVTGHSNDALAVGDDLFEGTEDDELLDAVEGMLHLVEGEEDDSLGGVEEFEGDLDDEINNGEVEGDFDSDIDYDDEEGEGFDDVGEGTEIIDESVVDEGAEYQGEDFADDGADVVFGGDAEEGADGEGDVRGEESPEEEDDNSPEGDVADEEGDAAAEDEGVSGDVGAEDPGNGVDDEGEGDPAEEESAAAQPRANAPEAEGEDSPEPEDVTPEEESPAEEPAVEPAVVPKANLPEEEAPDYFVPLTPEERTELKERLRATVRATRDALAGEGDPGMVQRTLVLGSGTPKRFMHMHHMKTGGTSLDGLIHCALRRQKDLLGGTSINYNGMSECGSRVKQCMNDLAKQLDASVVDNVFYLNDEEGAAKVDPQFSFEPSEVAGMQDLNVCKTTEAEVMSYCASLHAVRTFGWQDVDKVTVIRNPVDRAWSMYRFSLQGCYDCKEMKDVLRRVRDGTFVGRRGKSRKGDDEGEGRSDVSPNFVYEPNDSCAVQMIGHQATNLLSSPALYNVANDVRFPMEREIAEEAVRNLREVFTWIGVTDRIQESVDGFRKVFPFLSENLNDAAEAFDVSLPEGYQDEKGCPFEHRNAGRAPTCGTTEMDEETIGLIHQLTARDMAVYRAAVERFDLQQEVLEELANGSL